MTCSCGRPAYKLRFWILPIVPVCFRCWVDGLGCEVTVKYLQTSADIG